jgi:hypothetical protein
MTKQEAEEKEIFLCEVCQHGRWSYTQLLGGRHIVKEIYCGLTKDDSFCDGERFEDNENVI